MIMKTNKLTFERGDVVYVRDTNYRVEPVDGLPRHWFAGKVVALTSRSICVDANFYKVPISALQADDAYVEVYANGRSRVYAATLAGIEAYEFVSSSGVITQAVSQLRGFKSRDALQQILQIVNSVDDRNVVVDHWKAPRE